MSRDVGTLDTQGADLHLCFPREQKPMDPGSLECREEPDIVFLRCRLARDVATGFPRLLPLLEDEQLRVQGICPLG